MELPNRPYGDLVELNRIEYAIQEYDFASAMTRIEALTQARDPQVRDRNALLWGRLLPGLTAGHDSAGLARAWSLYERHLTSHSAIDDAAMGILEALGRNEELLGRLPSQRFRCAMTLMHLTRLDEILANYPEQLWVRSPAAFLSGHFDQIADPDNPNNPLMHEVWWISGHPERDLSLKDCPPGLRGRALISSGRLQDVLNDPTIDDELHARALLMLGRAQEAARVPGPPSALALMYLGRYDQARLTLGNDLPLQNEIRTQQALLTLLAGNRAGMTARLSEVVPDGFLPLRHGTTYDESVLIPWVTDICGLSHGALSTSCQQAQKTSIDQQRLRYADQLIVGAISEADFLQQPRRFDAKPRLHLYRAIRAQLQHDVPTEIAEETAWLSLPRWQRCGSGWDAVQIIIRWRMMMRGKPLPPEI